LAAESDFDLPVSFSQWLARRAIVMAARLDRLNSDENNPGKSALTGLDSCANRTFRKDFFPNLLK
jgi:hypothetical protein